MDIYLSGGWILTVDKSRNVIKDGAVAIEDEEIIDIGKKEIMDMKYKGRADIEIDCKKCIIMPGLINTHVHLVQALLRSCADYRKLYQWLVERVWVLEGSYNPNEALVSAKLAILEMIKSGTTTFLETFLLDRYGPDQIIEFILKAGIRAAVSRQIVDVTQEGSRIEGAYSSGYLEKGLPPYL
ncbi:MAG: amidohydrolase family protein [Thermofilaceae archaeon]